MGQASSVERSSPLRVKQLDPFGFCFACVLIGKKFVSAFWTSDKGVPYRGEFCAVYAIITLRTLLVSRSPWRSGALACRGLLISGTFVPRMGLGRLSSVPGSVFLDF